MTAHTFEPAAAMAMPAKTQARTGSAQPARSNDKSRHKDRVEYRLIFAAAFLVFLLASAIERLAPSRWSEKAAATAPRKTVVAQAKESASIAVGYAFMG